MKAPVKTWTPTEYPRLYRHKNGTCYARTKAGGKPTWRSLGTDILSIAKKELDAREATGHQQTGTGCGPPARKGMTGAQAFAIRRHQFQRHSSLKPSTKHYLEQVMTLLKRSWPELEAAELGKITPADCEAWARRTRPQTSGTRFNAALSMLRSLFEIALEHGVRCPNPAGRLKRSQVKLKDLTERLPTRTQFHAWVRAIQNAGGRFSRHCADYVEFLAYTGVRVGEAGWIKWEHCDFAHGELHVHGNSEHGIRNQESRQVPMTGALRSLLARLRKENPEAKPTDRILKVTTAKKAMNRAVAEIGIAHITHHDLRHFFAAVCIESGVDIPTVSRWLGHKDGGALAMKIYGHLRSGYSPTACQVSFDP
ncbi:MAG: hypothetical protein JWM59_3458 [Verrucomicrobiales bacterium]|nr:hypothetical protein [Verrucomicrobiales bacterium]